MAQAPPPIEEIEDRLEDLTDALREAGDDATADLLDGHAQGFSDPTAVRREVNAIRELLVRWRERPGELLDSAKVQLAANRLEDVCNGALGTSVIIEAAPLTVAERSRRLIAIVLGTLLFGSVLMLIPVLLVEAGVDLEEIGEVSQLPPVKLPRGEEETLELRAMRPAKLPDATRGAEMEVSCGGALGNGTCSETQPRLWPSGRLPTYELKLHNQAYGLVFSVVSRPMLGDVAQGAVLLAATHDTPEGRYELPVTFKYLGYTLQTCGVQDRLLCSCPEPRVGEGEAHAGVPARLVVVEVVAGDPARRDGERRRAEAEAEEAREKARERAAELAEAMGEIEKLTTATEKQMKKRRFREARDNVRKLTALFAPLDGVSLTEVAEDLPLEVGAVRVRIDKLQEQLHEFENEVFEETFATLTSPDNEKASEEKLLARVARHFRVDADYVQGIYTARATEIQSRLEAIAEARRKAEEAERAKREKRCGVLPANAWSDVGGYLEQLNPGVEIKLGECMTPRITDDRCWELQCAYERRVEISVERPKIVTKHSAKFFITHGRVVGHRGG